jgi:thiol peroxidase
MHVSPGALTVILTLGSLLAACAAQQAALPVNKGTVPAGGTVLRQGKEVRLLGTPVAVGNPLPATALIDATTMQPVDLARERGKVLFLSVVVSLDTGT